MQNLKVLKMYTASDGTMLVVYETKDGYRNVVPLSVFKRLTLKNK